MKAIRQASDTTAAHQSCDAWLPPAQRGPFVLPTTGRSIWWTGRVAIGIRHALAEDDAATLSSVDAVRTIS